MDAALESLKAQFPCRSEQIEWLYNLFGRKADPFPNCVYIYGGPSTGKTSIISTLLRLADVKCAYVNLCECYSSKMLFETLLNKLSGHAINPETGAPYAKCDNMMDFLRHLHRIHDDVTDLNGHVVILDRAEQLRGLEFNLLAGFLRFREISGLDISIVLISEIIFQKFYSKLNIVEPIKVYFPQYSRDQLIDILARDVPPGLIDDEAFYRNYLNVFLSVFCRACRDLAELKYTAWLNYGKYCEPVLRNEKGMNDSLGLWRHISPILKSSLEVLYLRISSINEHTNFVDANSMEVEQENKHYAFSKEKLAQSLELPFYAKYLLIAAYLASYNPAKDDKRLFMKYHGKKRKTMKDVKSKSKMAEQLNTQLGPKAFTFDRLLAIFYAILEEKVGFNNNLLVQVSSLVELQLLTSLSDNYNLDGQKYKCNVDYDFIQTISRMVGFKIRKYLVDFSHI